MISLSLRHVLLQNICISVRPNMTISADCNSENVTLRCDNPRIRQAPSRMYWLLNKQRIAGLTERMALDTAYDVMNVSNTITYDFNKGPLDDAECVVRWFEVGKEWVVKEGQYCSWWSHCNEAFSALPAFCDWEFRVVSLIKLLQKQFNYRWFETLVVYHANVECYVYTCIVKWV